MLIRTTHSNGLITYQSPLLRDIGVTHAFSTRIGGISTGPFASLNLGNPSGAAEQDPPHNIAENYRRLLAALVCPPDALHAWVTQVHGRRVELIEREGENEYAETLDAEIRDRFSGQLSADGIISVVPGVLLTIRIADCVPVLLATDDGRTVAAVHAGWRGVVGNIIAKALRTMHEAAGNSAAPEKIRAAIGPAISLAHFEVGEEVAAEFHKQDLAETIHTTLGPTPPKKPHIDLQHALGLQLQRAGVTQIDTNDLCTFRDAAEFFSHRRDHGTTGRMAAAIVSR